MNRLKADGQGGYTYLVTLIDDNEDVPLLLASISLTGKGAVISVTEVTKGTYLLILGEQSTIYSRSAF